MEILKKTKFGKYTVEHRHLTVEHNLSMASLATLEQKRNFLTAQIDKLNNQDKPDIETAEKIFSAMQVADRTLLEIPLNIATSIIVKITDDKNEDYTQETLLRMKAVNAIMGVETPEEGDLKKSEATSS